MGIGIDKGAMRRLRKTEGLFLSIFACSATVIMCGRLLWVAWATHTTYMPQRRGGHWVTLEHKEMGETLYNAPPIRLSETPARLSRAAATMTDLSAFTRRTLLDTLQDDQRCVAIKAKLNAPKG